LPTDNSTSGNQRAPNAISGMTVVHNASTTLPNTTAPFDVPFVGGSPFTYTGGGLYVAFDWQWAGPAAVSTVVACNVALASGFKGEQSNVSPPTTLATNSLRPETRLTPLAVTSDGMAISAAINGNAGSFTWNNGWTEGIDQTISTSASSSADHAETANGTDTASATATNQNRQAIVAVSLAVAH
jgi:hypothetical protein